MCTDTENMFPLGHRPFGNERDDGHEFNLTAERVKALQQEEVFRDQPAAAAQEERERNKQ